MSIVACPQCRNQVSLPMGASPKATVQCPLCSAEYELSTVLAQVPPALVVTGNGPARSAAFALPEVAEEPAFVGESAALHAAAAPAPLEEFSFEAAPAPLAAAAPETFELDEAGVPIDGEVTSLGGESFDLEELPLEGAAAGEQPLAFAPAEGEASGQAASFAPGTAAAIAMPAFEARAPRGRRREPSAIAKLIGVVLGGVLGCGIGYFIVLWIGGPDKDFLGLGPKLPRWSVPAAFNAGKQATGTSPAPTAGGNAGAAPSIAQASPRDVANALGRSTVGTPNAIGGDAATGAAGDERSAADDLLGGDDSAAALDSPAGRGAADDVDAGLGTLADHVGKPAADAASEILQTGADLPSDDLAGLPDAEPATGDDGLDDLLGDTAPAADMPADELPAADATGDDAPPSDDLFGDQPSKKDDDLFGDGLPADDMPADDSAADDDLVGEKPAKSAADDLLGDGRPADDMPADDLPTGSLPTDDLPADDLPADTLPADDMPADELPADEPGLLDVPGDEAPATTGADDALPAADLPADDLPTADSLPAADADVPGDGVPDADVPAPDGKAPDTTAAIRPAGAPETSAAELQAAVADYRQSRAAAVAAEQAGDADAKKLHSQSFVKLYQLAAAASFADAGARSAAREDVLRAAREIAAESDSPDHLGRAAAKWLQFPKRGANAGIVLAGTVVSSTQHGKLCEVVLQLAPDATASIVRSCDPHWPTGQRLLVVGSIVDDPKTNLAGYEGDSAQVVWMRICEVVEQ